MYKPLYLLDAAISAPFEYGSALLEVPVAAYNFIAARMVPGDWSYLQIRYKNVTEIVKVIGLMPPSSLIVVRKIDGTEEAYFPVGSTLSHVITVAGVLDTYIVPTLALAADAAIEIADGTVSYPNINFAASLGLLPVGSGAHLAIVRNEAAYGCCDGDNAPEEL
jgi:hypothetical protein